MQVSKAFRDLVLGTALKGFRYDSPSGKIIPIISLTGLEIDRITQIAASSYGMTIPSETRDAVYNVLNETDPFSGAPEKKNSLRIDRISPGEIIELTHSDGATLKLLATGNLQFRVLDDTEKTLCAGDVVIPLCFTITCQSQLCLEVTRNSHRYPDESLYYYIDPVASIAITRNNISALTSWLDEDETDDESEMIQSLNRARAFNADYSGRMFNASSLVDADCRSAIFEINIDDMSLILNPDIELDDENRHDAVIAEILRVCDRENDNQFDNLYRIVCTSPGIVEPVSSGGTPGTYDFNIIQPPIVRQQ